MRPVKLTMSAFGPFADETVIDFDALGKNGIYLVSGETGAGKTTIFDGITYALFDNATCERKNDKMFRSQYADKNTKTFVELEFICNGKKYTVKRNPQYSRPKVSGEGETVQPASAELIMPDGSVVTQKTNVDNRINEILGITGEQFKQIALIAQGDFLNLLNADTTKRINIFRDIFNTKIIETFQNDLSAKLSEVESNRKSAKDSIRQYINGIACDKESTDYITLQKLRAEDAMVADVLAFLNSIIEKDGVDYKKVTEDLAVIDESLGAVNKSLGQAQEQKKAQETLNEQTAKLKLAEERIAAVKEKLDAAKQNEPEIEKLKEKAVKIDEVLPEYEKLEDVNKQLAESVNSLTSKQSEKNRTAEAVNALTERIQKLKEEQASLTDSGVNIEKLQKSIEDDEKKKSDIGKLLDSFAAYEKLRDEKEQKQKEYTNYKNEAEQASQRAAELRTQFNDAQAGIMAETLNDGEACPVCGSVTHPHKAVKPASAPTQADVEKAEQDAKIANGRANFASEKSGEVSGRFTNAESQLKKDAETFLNVSEIVVISASAKEKIAELDALIKENRAKKEKETAAKGRAEKLSDLIPEQERKKDALTKEQNAFDADIAALTEKVENLKKQISEIKSKLTFESKDDAENTAKKLRIDAYKIKNDIDRVTAEFNEANSAANTCRGAINSAKELLKDAPALDSEKLENEKNALDCKKNELKKVFNELNSRLDSNNNIKVRLSEKAEDLDALDKKWQTVSVLSNTANGNLSGKVKVKFETYIQTFYFDRIIVRANVHLQKMSSGKYEFIRSEPDSRRTQSGLDLDIIDHYNGSVRMAKSLSGGESFVASLSLALGLSEEIQASAGGVKLDTMFVDEGFGTLDSSYLHDVMKALQSLSENNRLIGIISHVDEFKEKIDKQIIVERPDKGPSRVKIIV